MDKKKFVNKPWMLLTAPLIGGCVWLASHPEIITDNINKPYALLAFPVAAGSVLVLWLVINFFKVIASWCQVTWKSLAAWSRKDGSLFWLVTIVFLTVSVLESGNFFDYILQNHDMYGLLGYAVALGFDLISVMSMRARQKAVRLHDRKGERINQTGVVMSALASTFANAFTALQQYTLPTGALMPDAMKYAAPVVGAIFPLFMIFLSFAGDYTADQSQVSLDPEEFKSQQESRLKLIEIRRDALRREVALQKDMEAITGRTSKEKRVFFLKNWLFPVEKHQDVSPELVQKIVEELRELLPESAQTIAQSSANIIVEDITNSAQTLPPTSQKVLPEKTQSSVKETDPTLQKVDKTLGLTSHKPSGPDTGKLSSKVSKVLSSNTAQDLGKVTQKLSAELLKSFEEGSAEENAKIDITNRNAITKVEAAQYLQCSVEDINAAIKKGQIKMYGSSKDKVLVSTLKNYTPTKRRRTKESA